MCSPWTRRRNLIKRLFPRLQLRYSPDCLWLTCSSYSNRIQSLARCSQPGQPSPPIPRNAPCEHWCSSTLAYSQRRGVLRRQADQRRGTLQQLVFPSSLRPDVLASLHDDMGHQGYERTMELLRPRVYWPAMYREARDYISSCERCTMGHAPALHTTSSHLLASRPLQNPGNRLHVA